MYDSIFAKSFSRYERIKFGLYGLILCLIIAFSICSTLKPHLHPLTLIGDAIDLKLSINSIEDTLITHETVKSSNVVEDMQRVQISKDVDNLFMTHDEAENSNGVEDKQLITKKVENSEDIENMPIISDTVKNSGPKVVNDAVNLQLTINDAKNRHRVNDTSTISQSKVEKIVEPLCRVLNSDADYCELEGDIRIQPDSSTIFVLTSHTTISNVSTNIQPYPRKGISHVKHWTVKSVGYNDKTINIPKCTKNHNSPSLLFSTGGYTGNHFHDFADLIFPLYWTSSHFQKNVHLLVSDFKPWWIGKYREIINRLTKHEIVNIDEEKEQVHCYQKMVAGLKFHKELVMDGLESEYPTGVSMYNFRQLLRQTYSLERKRAIKSRRGDKESPRLLIVSRKWSRILTNEGEVSKVARKLGFEVVLAEADVSTNLSRFAQIVNSCDVMMGIHGAGLTNMLFLPDNAVLIQLVPLGQIDIFARLDFGNPAPGMNLRYLEYKITSKESSLSRQYPADHPVLTDPMSFHRKGWDTIMSIYLNNQNVTVDVRRFKGTLVKALKILRH